MSNPLIEAVRRFIEARPEGISEHELICSLESEPGMIDHRQGNLSLFQAHFMVMNALYHLQSEFIRQRQLLTVTPLAITLEPLHGEEKPGLPISPGEVKLRDYYLDWSNLEQTSGDDVDDLLGSFWQRYYAMEHQPQALVSLGLAAEASWSEIEQSYRRLAAKHHPDRGGDKGRFIEVREAYTLLKRCRR